MTAATEITDSLEELSEQQKADFKEDLPHLVDETPHTAAATHRVKAVWNMMKPASKEILTKVLTQCLCEAVKNSLKF